MKADEGKGDVDLLRLHLSSKLWSLHGLQLQRHCGPCMHLCTCFWEVAIALHSQIFLCPRYGWSTACCFCSFCTLCNLSDSVLKGHVALTYCWMYVEQHFQRKKRWRLQPWLKKCQILIGQTDRIVVAHKWAQPLRSWIFFWILGSFFFVPPTWSTYICGHRLLQCPDVFGNGILCKYTKFL